MTDLNQLVEVGARAQMASAAYSSFWSVTDHKVMIKEGILAILPLLADDLAGAVAWAHMMPPDGGSPTDDEKAVADNAAEIIRTRIAAIIEGEGK